PGSFAVSTLRVDSRFSARIVCLPAQRAAHSLRLDIGRRVQTRQVSISRVIPISSTHVATLASMGRQQQDDELRHYEVSTGIETIGIEELPAVTAKMVCPACGRVHNWTKAGSQACPQRRAVSTRSDARARHVSASLAGSLTRAQKQKGAAFAAPCTGPPQWVSRPRLRDDADIGLRRLPTLRVLFLRFLVADRTGDDHVLALLPIHRRRHLVLG